MDRKSTNWFIRLACVLGILLTPFSGLGQASNAIPISGGPVVTPFNTPAINAPVRVCAVTAIGNPCSTAGVTLYSDYNLTQPINNPTATNSQGVYNAFTVAGFYLIQVQVTPTVSYSYYYLSSVGSGTLVSGILTFDDLSGDACAAINNAFTSYNVVEVTTGNPTGTTTCTIPNAATGLNGIPGTLVIRGTGTFTVPQILFQDSTTASVPSGLISCPDGATIMLANGSNKSLISDTNFSSLTGGSSLYGAFQARVDGCILDANKANNSSGWAYQVYGRAQRLLHGKSFNGAQGGIWVELDHPGDVFNTKLDDLESKIEDWQSGFNTGPGLNIHAGDTYLTDVSTYLNSTWGVISSYNSVHVHGVNSYGNTLGGCWATTTGTFFGDDLVCSTLTSGIGLLEDSTAAPFNLASSSVGGPGIGIEVEQPGNVFQGVINTTTTSSIALNGGSINFVGSICPTSGYWIDYTLSPDGNSSIMTSQSCPNGTLFNGTPPQGDTLFFPGSGATGLPYFQMAGSGVLHTNGIAVTFPSSTAATLAALNHTQTFTSPQTLNTAIVSALSVTGSGTLGNDIPFYGTNSSSATGRMMLITSGNVATFGDIDNVFSGGSAFQGNPAVTFSQSGANNHTFAVFPTFLYDSLFVGGGTQCLEASTGGEILGTGLPCGSGGGTTTNALTMNSSGSGASPGTTFNGAVAQTLSYNTIGAAPAISACSDESSTFTPANGNCYFVTASVSTTTPAASSFVVFVASTNGSGQLILTGTTITNAGNCAGYISGTTFTLPNNQTVSVKSDGTNVWASCT